MKRPPSEEELSQAAAVLRTAGVDNPAREARLIAAIEGGESFDRLVQRRAAGEPFAHLAGRCGFYTLDLKCDARALIPRADSETLVEVVLELFAEDVAFQVADLGTGSGCLLLAILQERAHARGVGVEASSQAASLARENAVETGLAGRAEIVERSWRDWEGWTQADLIVSNPPYIPSVDIKTLQPEVRDYDPRAALDGGEDGLEAYRSILEIAGGLMKPDAWLVFEIGYDQAEAVCALLLDAGFEAIAVRRDLGGRDRIVSGRRPSVSVAAK